MKAKTLQVRDWEDGELKFVTGISRETELVQIELPKDLITRKDLVNINGSLDYVYNDENMIVLYIRKARDFVGDYDLINIRIVEIDVE